MSEGFRFVLGAIVALGLVVAAYRVCLIVMALCVIASGWIRWRWFGATCGYNVYSEGWRYQDCDRAPHHLGNHECTDKYGGYRIAFWGWAGCHGSHRIDLPADVSL